MARSTTAAVPDRSEHLRHPSHHFQDITAQKCTIAVLAGTEPRQRTWQPRQVKFPGTGWPDGNFIT